MDCVLNWNHQQQPVVPNQELDPTKADQLDHVISANESETVEIQITTMDWARELTELFRRHNTEVIHLAIQGLRTKQQRV
jgi:hypothetical protein